MQAITTQPHFQSIVFTKSWVPNALSKYFNLSLFELPRPLVPKQTQSTLTTPHAQDSKSRQLRPQKHILIGANKRNLATCEGSTLPTSLH